MSNPEQRLFIGLKALGPSQPAARSQPMTLAEGMPWPQPSHPAIRTDPPLAWQAALLPIGEKATSGANHSLLRLEALMQQPGEPLSESRLLGVCEEKPGLIGLQPGRKKKSFQVTSIELAPGSLVIAGDPGSGRTRLLRRLLACAAAQNSSNQVGFYLAAHQPAQYCDIGHLDHCRLVTQTDDRALGKAVHELAELVQGRRSGQPHFPAVVLAIDDLASALPNLAEPSLSLLYWLIRHGPSQQIWTVATLSTGCCTDLGLRFLEAFRSRLIGHIAEREQAQALSFSPNLAAWNLEKGRQFYLPFGNIWLRFRACDVANFSRQQVSAHQRSVAV